MRNWVYNPKINKEHRMNEPQSAVVTTTHQSLFGNESHGVAISEEAGLPFLTQLSGGAQETAR